MNALIIGGSDAAYLKATGIAIRPPRGWGKIAPAKPANGVTTGSGANV